MKKLFLLVFYFYLIFFITNFFNTSNCFQFNSVKDFVFYKNTANINETKVPTIVTRFTKNGLIFLSLIANSFLNKEFPNVKFPVIYFPINTDIGNGEVYVNNLKIDELYSPDVYLKFKPSNGVFLWSNDGSVRILGDWTAKYTLFFDFYASGWIEANVYGFFFEFLTQSYSKNGRPQINITNCAIQIQSLNVTIGGGAIPWLINLFNNGLTRLIKQTIHDQFCLTAQTTLAKAINNKLQTFPIRFNLFNEIYLQYFYANNLIIENNDIIGQANINVMYGKHQCTISPNPIWMDPFSSKNYMVNFWISSNVLQCFAEALHKSNVLKFVLTNETDNEILKTFLKTSCKLSEFCLGKLFPSLSVNYSNSFIDLYIHSAKTPTINVGQSGILSDTYAFVDFFESPMKKNTKSLARLELISSFHFKPILKYNRISGILKKDAKFKFKEIFSNIGGFHEEILNILTVIFEPVFKILINGQLRGGIPLPLIENITLSGNSQVVTMDTGEIRIDSDLVYV